MRVVPLLVLATTLVACGFDSQDPEAERAELRQHGREVYVTYCSLCHGENADGRGVNADMVRGDPADFTDPAWQAGVTRESVRRVIVEGVPGTSMAAWGLLPERDVEGLVEYLLGVSDGSNVRSGRAPAGRGRSQMPQMTGQTSGFMPGAVRSVPLATSSGRPGEVVSEPPILPEDRGSVRSVTWPGRRRDRPLHASQIVDIARLAR